MRIVFLSHYFPPEVNAPATRTYEHCVRWVRAGNDVTVVTCVPNCPDGIVYEGYRNRLVPQHETIDGIKVVRVWTFLAANRGFVGRILNYVSFMVSSVWTFIFLKQPDIVVATSPQFFCGWAGVIGSRLRRVPFVLEIRDIWPESITAVGAMKRGLIVRFLEWLERIMYRSADHIIAVGEGYRDNIIAKVDVAARTTVITNGVDLDKFQPIEPDMRLLHLWNLENKFVCAYIGTIGMAHGLEVVLEAAALLKARGRDDIRFCLIGDGANRIKLESLAHSMGVDGMLVFTGRVPRADIPFALASSNACLIHLRRCELFGSVIPSKIFETMAMKRPIIIGVQGTARDIVIQADAGIEMTPDSATSLVSAVERLADDPSSATHFGDSAREFVERHFNRDRLAREYLGLLYSIAGIADEKTSVEDIVDAAQPLELVDR